MSSLAELLSAKTERQRKGLAKRADIELSRLEALAGGHEPTMAEVRRLSRALGIAVEDFVRPQANEERRTEMLFRHSAGEHPLPSSAGSLARRIASSVDIVVPRTMPRWKQYFLPPENTLGNAEDNARIFRKVFCNDDQLSPLMSLPRIVSDRMGVFLFTQKNDDFDGASAFLNGVAFAFVSYRFPARMLFTLGHEVGHLIAHHDGDYAHMDEEVEATWSKRADEYYANAFSSALLMPRESVGLSLKTIRRVASIAEPAIGDLEINYLSRIYGVSFWAAARRCEDLDLLPTGGAYALYKAQAEEYGSPEKRADIAGLPARAEIKFPPVPLLLVEAALERIRTGDLSVGRAANVLGLSIPELITANAPQAH